MLKKPAYSTKTPRNRYPDANQDMYMPPLTCRWSPSRRRRQGSEERNGAGDFFRTAGTAQRDVAEQGVAQLRQRARHVGVDETGGDAVDRDVAAPSSRPARVMPATPALAAA